MTIKDSKGTEDKGTVIINQGTDVNQKSSTEGSPTNEKSQTTGGDNKEEGAGQPKKKSDALGRAFSKIGESNKALSKMQEDFNGKFGSYDEKLTSFESKLDKLIEVFGVSDGGDDKDAKKDGDIQAQIDAAVAKALKEAGLEGKKPEDKPEDKDNETLEDILVKDLSEEQIDKLREIEDTIGIDDDILLKHLKANRGDISKAIEEFTKEQKTNHEASIKAAENLGSSNSNEVDIFKKVKDYKTELKKIPTANGVLTAIKKMIE